MVCVRYWVDAERKQRDVSQVMHDSIGFDHCISLEEFTDASNGYVIADTCLLGAEVHVSKDGKALSRCQLLHIFPIIVCTPLISCCHFVCYRDFEIICITSAISLHAKNRFIFNTYEIF